MSLTRRCHECGTALRHGVCRECDPCMLGRMGECVVAHHDHEPTPDELARFINPEARYP